MVIRCPRKGRVVSTEYDSIVQECFGSLVGGRRFFDFFVICFSYVGNSSRVMCLHTRNSKMNE